MATRSQEAYIKSLQDGRTVYYRGQRVPDVTSHPLLKTAVEHAALEYELSEDAQHRDLLLVHPLHLAQHRLGVGIGSPQPALLLRPVPFVGRLLRRALSLGNGGEDQEAPHGYRQTGV